MCAYLYNMNTIISHYFVCKMLIFNIVFCLNKSKRLATGVFYSVLTNGLRLCSCDCAWKCVSVVLKNQLCMRVCVSVGRG